MTAALHGHDDVSTDSPASDLDVGLVSCVSGQVAARAKASVLRLRGLPFAASDSDVEGFFGGYDIVEVYICRRDGEWTRVLQAQHRIASVNLDCQAAEQPFKAVQAVVTAVSPYLWCPV